MKQRKPLNRVREEPRRKRPELFHEVPGEESWPKISMRMRLKWWGDGEIKPVCGICGGRIYLWSQLVPDHIVPGKMGGCKDHSESNLQPAHFWCNRIKGSKRVAADLKARTA